MIYKMGLAKFVEMLNTRKNPLPLQKLLQPIVLLNAIVKSIEMKKEIFLYELDGE
jgi:hypothetical protein